MMKQSEWKHLETISTRTVVDHASRDRARVPCLTLIAHPDMNRVGERLFLPELLTGQEVRISRLEPGFSAPDRGGFRPLADAHLSRSPVCFRGSLQPGAVTVDVGRTRTPLMIDGIRIAGARVLSADEVQRGVVLLLGRRVVLLLHMVAPLNETPPSFGLVGESDGLLQVRRTIQRVSSLDVPVLIRGATGTGKELVARAVYESSPRRHQDYIIVNMGAIPESLAASELFGAARGAYTGADRKKVGFFERAAGGTIFLDEIGETPPDVQAALLRVLESGEIQPVGSTDTRRVDVRVIAATDADLESAIESGRFREPLYHRLAGADVVLPPLRERRDDLGRLLVHFLRQELVAAGATADLNIGGRPWPSAEVMGHLALHHWPGNVRELRNVARRLVLDRANLDGGMKTVEEMIWRATSPPTPAPDVKTGQVSLAPDPASYDRATTETVDLEEELADYAASIERPPTRYASDAETAPLPPATPYPDSSAPQPIPLQPTPPPEPVAPPVEAKPRYRKPSEVSEEELLEALAANAWELKPTAAVLNVSRTTLYRLIENCTKIRKAVDLTVEEVESAIARHGGDLGAAAAELQVSPQGLKRRKTAIDAGAE